MMQIDETEKAVHDEKMGHSDYIERADEMEHENKSEQAEAAEYVDKSEYLEQSPGHWLVNLFILRIPVFGLIYLIGKVISRNTPEETRSFYKGYLLYKVIMLGICMILLFIGIQVAAHYIQLLLEYMKML